MAHWKQGRLERVQQVLQSQSANRFRKAHRLALVFCEAIGFHLDLDAPSHERAVQALADELRKAAQP